VFSTTGSPCRTASLAAFSSPLSSGRIFSSKGKFPFRQSKGTLLPVPVSVADPDPYPDPYVFGPPGSVSASLRYRSGCGSFYHQAKTVKCVDSYCFVTYFCLSIFEK
jgi:hypothetical protein